MDSSMASNDTERVTSQLSKSQRLELEYKETLLNTELVIKDEHARRLRLRALMLENENDELHEKLAVEGNQIDLMQQESDDLRTQLDRTQEGMTGHEAELRSKARELVNLKAELSSMNGITTDSTKVLTEKLTLARELATLKPEVESLRSQTSHQQTILAEKLALERQVSSLEVELETEKRASKRAAQKTQHVEREVELLSEVETLHKELARERRIQRTKKSEREKELQSEAVVLQKELAREKRQAQKNSQKGAELQEEVEKLRRELVTEKRSKKAKNSDKMDEMQGEIEESQKELVKEKRLVQKAHKTSEGDSELQNQIDTLKKELAREKRLVQKAQNNDKEAEFQIQVDALQKEIAREKKEGEKARKEGERELQSKIEKLLKDLAREQQEKSNATDAAGAELQAQLAEAQEDLAREKREHEKARIEAEKELQACETRHTVLESRLDEMRIKFRATKEALKECRAELVQVRAVAAKATTKAEAKSKHPRKRMASEMAADVTIGTPDGVAVRGKKAAFKGRDHTLVGEKSMFSITPFLNRTVNVDPDILREESELEGEEATETKPKLQVSAVPGAENVMISEEQATSTPTAAPKPKGRRKAAEKKVAAPKNVLGEAKPAVKNKKLGPKKFKGLSSLENVDEEEVDENDEPGEAIPDAENLKKTSKPSKVQMKVTTDEDAGLKAKKRKVLGGAKTLFDDDDVGATKRTAKVTLGAPQLLGRGGLAGPKGGLKGDLGVASGLGGFSPLKKHRRGVGASFLA